MPGRFEQVKVQVEAVELLRILHRVMSYSEISRLTSVPRSTLAQYIGGFRLPSAKQAEHIVKSVLEGFSLRSVIMSRLKAMGSIVDLENIVLDPLVLKISSVWASRVFGGKVDKVLSAETIGVPFATAIALRLEADLVLARKSPESPRREYVRGEAGEPPFNVKVFYVPRDRLPRGSHVLLVDDLARTGVTLEALAKAARKAGAVVEGAVVIVAVGGEWRERLARQGVERNVYALLELG